MQLAEAELAITTANQEAATDELATAQTEFAEASENGAAAAAELARLQAAEDDIRRRLQAAATRADAEALSLALEASIIEMQAQSLAIADADERLDLAERALRRAQAEAGRTTADVAQAAARLDDAHRIDDEHDAWDDALADPPLATLPADAQTVVSSQAHADAQARVEAEIPDALRDRARARRDAEAQRTQDLDAAYRAAEAELDVEVAKDGYRGKSAAARHALEGAEEPLRDHVARAAERFQRAQALLAPIADAPQLTTEEQDRIARSDPTDPAQAALADAIADEEALESARSDLRAAEIALEDAEIVVLAADPDADVAADPSVVTAQGDVNAARTALHDASATWGDVLDAGDALAMAEENLAAARTAFLTANPGGDPSTAPAVVAARAAVDGATTDLGNARAARRTAMAPLDSWEVAVPEAAWRRLADFDEATALLDAIANTDPTALRDEVASKEQVLVDALDEEDTSERIRRALQRFVWRRDDRTEAARRTEGARAFGALRGDR